MGFQDEIPRLSLLEAAWDFSSGDSYRVLKTKRTSDGHSNCVTAPKPSDPAEPCHRVEENTKPRRGQIGTFLATHSSC